MLPRGTGEPGAEPLVPLPSAAALTFQVQPQDHGDSWARGGQGPRGLTWAGSHGPRPWEGGLAGARGQTCSVPGCPELEEARPLGNKEKGAHRTRPPSSEAEGGGRGGALKGLCRYQPGQGGAQPFCPVGRGHFSHDFVNSPPGGPALIPPT